MTLLWGASLAAGSRADEDPRPPGDAVQAAFDRFVEAAGRAGEPAELEAREALASLGPDVVPMLAEAARGHGERRVRRSCYELLARSFADDERTVDALIRHGLHDENPGIRCYSAAALGEVRSQQAEPALRAALEEANGKRDSIRFTIAEALARLGKAEVMPVLIEGVSDEAYAWRQAGNAGLKALSGKSLEDFDGYDCREGAYTSGGTFSMPLDALTSAERKVGRFRAAAAYLKWLKAERPELYQAVNDPYSRAALSERRRAQWLSRAPHERSGPPKPARRRPPGS
jgi:HEAT repeat protein